MSPIDYKTIYLTERDSGREDAILKGSVIAPSLVSPSHSKKPSLPIVKGITPKNEGDIVIPIRLVKSLYNAGIQDAELLDAEVMVRLTSTAGAKGSGGGCHYCGEDIRLEHREKVVLTSEQTNRDFHTNCYQKFLDELGRILQENKAELAAYNI